MQLPQQPPAIPRPTRLRIIRKRARLSCTAAEPDKPGGRAAGSRIITAVMSATGSNEAKLAAEVDQLVDEHRIECLWFLRPDYHPATDQERIRVLEHIERHGDLKTFRRAATLRRWLLQTSNVVSADS